ncbi:hypothetical protein R1flu_020615 [Riccia fluitans]|uniref:Protein kinase domain-containing protein n=1 Tax=Riccia fluitans TaxID=41844 RepID=A0ABD1ZM02_9MARC
MYSRVFDLINDGNGKSVQTTYLWLLGRMNLGGDPTLPSLRYPQDPFDRLWFPPDINIWHVGSGYSSVKNTTVLDLSKLQLPDVQPPEAVMSTAWEGNVTFATNLSAPGAQEAANYYFNFLLYDVNPTRNRTRFMDIFYDEGNGFELGYWDVEVTDRKITQLWSKSMTFLGDSVTVTVRPNRSSMLPGMMNAVELYGEFSALKKRTVQDDARAVLNFSRNFASQLDEAGDPWRPIAWAWLVCSIELPPRVTQINLTSKGFGGELPLDFGGLSRLTVLDLSNNSFSGPLPNSFANISAIRELNLERNELSGEFPTFAAKSWQNLETLSLSQNRFNGSLSSLISALDDTISHLNLSSNSFSGSIPLEINLTNLQDLDLSGNQLSGELRLDLPRLQNLQMLNMDSNNLEGRVPDISWGNSSLEVVSLNQNNFTDMNLATWYQCVLDGNISGQALAKEHVKPPFFRYDELKTATQGFSKNTILGKGGFGTAELQDGSVVAVKRLKPTEQNMADFLKEMVNITGIKHRNLIQLKGCCPRMVHRDIKPQNILLDKDFNAKIADFGLVRPATSEDTQSISVKAVSDKLDVYSFGVVVLEIVSGRRCLDFKQAEIEIFLRHLALRFYEDGKLLELVDPELMGNYDEDEALLLLHTALACSQLDTKRRPTMSQVMSILMKNTEVAIDIVNEMKSQKPDLHVILEDDTTTHQTSKESDDSEARSFLSFSSAERSDFKTT